MKKSNIFLFFFFCLILLGCDTNFNQNYELKYSKQIEYSNNTIDPCELITSIDTIKIKDVDRRKNHIDLKQYDISCSDHIIKDIGKQETIITINGFDTYIDFEVVDTTAPKIKIKKNLEVEQDNPYFDIKKLVDVVDNYDLNPVIGFSGKYDLSVPGTYKVKINAKDTAGNKSSLNVEINVKDKDVEIIEKPVIVDKPGSGNSNNKPVVPGNPSVPDKPNKPVIPSKPNIKPANKKFLFVDGYNFTTAKDACVSYRSEMMKNYIGHAACNTLKNENNEYIGYEAVFD